MKCLVILVLLGMAGESLAALTIGTSLAQCQAVAAKFRNTCTSSPATWDATFASQTISCSQRQCPNGVSGTSCTWTRQLCVSCLWTGSYTQMRIQSNGMPDHCFSSPYPVKAQKIDFTIKFNPSTGAATNFASQTAFDTQSCNELKTKNSLVPAGAIFTPVTTTGYTNLDTSVGITLNGVLIQGSNSPSYGEDPYYPNYWENSPYSIAAELVDACLGIPEYSTGIYHYIALPPCLMNTSILSNTSCAGVPSCYENLRTYALAAYTTTYNTDMILGVAKDGHMIIGPYTSTPAVGTEYLCTTFDQCSGRTITDGAGGTSYVYVFQNKYPYVADCFGPGTAIPAPTTTNYQASCSSNTCLSQASNLIPSLILVLGISLISLQ